MGASRTILCELIEFYDHRYHSGPTTDVDDRPEGLFVRYRVPEKDGDKARYCEGVVTIYREGVDPESLDPKELAAIAADPTSELIYLAHELGHHHSDLLAGVCHAFDQERPKETFTEEVRAWEIGKRLLDSRGFSPWEAFHAVERQRLHEYRVGLELAEDAADDIEYMARRDLVWSAPPSNPALNPKGLRPAG